MVDMDPTNINCVYSTLYFINRHCLKYDIIPLVTFDQPLWFKAKQIQIQCEEFNYLTLNLGGFHTIMSFLGAIGHIMKGSGLESVLQLVYASHTVKHMLVGKAYERSIRGHLIVDVALNSIIMKKSELTNSTEKNCPKKLWLCLKIIYLMRQFFQISTPCQILPT